MVYLGLARRLSLAGDHGLVKTSWSCQVSWSWSREYHDILGTWDNVNVKDTFELYGVLVPHLGIVWTFVYMRHM